jgi:hypothetical protein
MNTGNIGGITRTVWNPREWKRALVQLQNRCRSSVGELFSAVANEETELARMELEGRLESVATNRGPKDKK